MSEYRRATDAFDALDLSRRLDKVTSQSHEIEAQRGDCDQDVRRPDHYDHNRCSQRFNTIKQQVIQQTVTNYIMMNVMSLTCYDHEHALEKVVQCVRKVVVDHTDVATEPIENSSLREKNK